MNRTTRILRRAALPLLTALVASALPACTSGDAATGTAGGVGAGGTGTATDPLAPFTSCDDDDITDSFAGPGYDATKGGLQPPVQATYVAATTVLLTSTDPAKAKAFGQFSTPVITDVQQAAGFVGFQISISSKCHYARTLTVWKDMDAMMTFVMSPNHVNAMSHATETGDGGATTNWTIASADFPPTWAMARQEILKQGALAY